MTHPCPPGFRFRDEPEPPSRGGAGLCPNQPSFSDRMRRVFRRYPDPWVGIWTYEVTTAPFAQQGMALSYYLDYGVWEPLGGLGAAARMIELDAAAAGHPDAKSFYVGLIERGEHYSETLRPDEDLPRGEIALVPWIAKEVNRILKRERRPHVELHDLSSALPELTDWVTAERPDIMGISWRDAINRAEAWHARFAARARTRSRVAGGGDTIYRWSDGWHADLLTTHAELVAEGCAMGHCVGDSDYWEDVREGRTRIVSLRDYRAASKITLELHFRRSTSGSGGFWTLVQAKGFGNRLPRPDECIRIDEMGHAFEWQQAFGFGSGNFADCPIAEAAEAAAAMNEAGVTGEMTAEGEEAFFA